MPPSDIVLLDPDFVQQALKPEISDDELAKRFSLASSVLYQRRYAARRSMKIACQIHGRRIGVEFPVTEKSTAFDPAFQELAFSEESSTALASRFHTSACIIGNSKLLVRRAKIYLETMGAQVELLFAQEVSDHDSESTGSLFDSCASLLDNHDFASDVRVGVEPSELAISHNVPLEIAQYAHECRMVLDDLLIVLFGQQSDAKLILSTRRTGPNAAIFDADFRDDVAKKVPLKELQLKYNLLEKQLYQFISLLERAGIHHGGE